MKNLRKLFAGVFLLFAPGISQAVTLYADTNGDGVTDTITTGSNSWDYFVQIYHPNTGIKTTYLFGKPYYFEVVATSNTNGLPGDEVIVRMTTQTNNYLSIIDDAKRTKRTYSFAWDISFFNILSFENNTDGLAGNEIVIHTYSTNSTGMHVVDDARAQTRYYNFGSAAKVNDIPAITDTNGAAGDEIIVEFLGSSTSGPRVGIIEDARAVTRNYTFGLDLKAFDVLTVRNYDGLAGSEVCYSYATSWSSGYGMIVDRTQQKVSRTGC